MTELRTVRVKHKCLVITTIECVCVCVWVQVMRQQCEPHKHTHTHTLFDRYHRIGCKRTGTTRDTRASYTNVYRIHLSASGYECRECNESACCGASFLFASRSINHHFARVCLCAALYICSPHAVAIMIRRVLRSVKNCFGSTFLHAHKYVCVCI